MIDHNFLSPMYWLNAWQLSLILVILMIVCIRLGSKVGKQRLKEEGYVDNPANTTVFGSVFGLLAFLLAFTFNMSANRFDERTQASITEANNISITILRADLYPDSDRIAFRRDIKGYLQARIENITAGTDFTKINAADATAFSYKNKIWRRATWYLKAGNNALTSDLMITALNAMFESASTNEYTELLRVPQSIVAMLFVLSLVSSFFVGYLSVTKGKFDWFSGIGFCFLSALVIFITLDLDQPRRGLIQHETSHQAIISLMDEFKNE